jgi:hypothetical protein
MRSCLGLGDYTVLVLVEVIEAFLLAFTRESDAACEGEATNDCYDLLHAVSPSVNKTLCDVGRFGRPASLLQGACHWQLLPALPPCALRPGLPDRPHALSDNDYARFPSSLAGPERR